MPVEKVFENHTNISAAHYNPHGVEEEDLLEPEQYAEEIKELLQASLTNIESLLGELQS